MSKAADHYDRVTGTWRRWIMGEELHYGYFETGDETLAEATQRLTALMTEKAVLEAGHRVLDVGCGVGTQSVDLAEQHGCEVTGISTSEVGIAAARAQPCGADPKPRFLVADAAHNGLPDGAFDRIWSLESAHLMPDKAALLAECFRVLAPGGRLVLCDCTLVGAALSRAAESAGYVAMGHSTAVAARMRQAVHDTMHRAFGSSHLEHFDVYAAAARAAGFVELSIEDISAPTKPTFERWGKNASDNWETIEAELGRAYLDDFFLALLHMSFNWGRSGGYMLLHAQKPA